MRAFAKIFCLMVAMSLWLSGHASGQRTGIDPATGLQESYGPDTASNIIEQSRKEAEAIRAWDEKQSALITNSFQPPPSPSDSEVRRELLAEQERDTRKFSHGQGDSDLFQDLYNVNGALGDDEATYALFQQIAQNNPKLATDCEFTMEPLLVRRGDYQMCLDYMGNPESEFQFYCSLLSAHEAFGQGMDQVDPQNEQKIREIDEKYDELRREHGVPPLKPISHPHMGQYVIERAKSNFVSQVCCLVEVLVGTGHEPEAEYIREKAMTVLDDARIQSAVIHAEEHIKNPKAVPSAGEMEAKASPACLAGLEPVQTFPVAPPPSIPAPVRIDPGTGLPTGPEAP